jgi:hypothetical protein
MCSPENLSGAGIRRPGCGTGFQWDPNGHISCPSPSTPPENGTMEFEGRAQSASTSGTASSLDTAIAGSRSRRNAREVRRPALAPATTSHIAVDTWRSTRALAPAKPEKRLAASLVESHEVRLSTKSRHKAGDLDEIALSGNSSRIKVEDGVCFPDRRQPVRNDYLRDYPT